MKEITEKFEKLHIVVVNTLYEENAPVNYNHPGLYYLGKTIDDMGIVDAVYFTRDWQSARGCRLEREIAKAYGVKILDYDFLEESKEEAPTIKDPLQSIFDPPDLSDWFEKTRDQRPIKLGRNIDDETWRYKYGK